MQRTKPSNQNSQNYSDIRQIIFYKLIVALTLIIAVIGVAKLLNIWERQLVLQTQEEIYKRLWINDSREVM